LKIGISRSRLNRTLRVCLHKTCGNCERFLNLQTSKNVVKTWQLVGGSLAAGGGSHGTTGTMVNPAMWAVSSEITDGKFRQYIFSENVIVRLSVVCNVRAHYSVDYNFRQCFYAVWYLGHPWPVDKNFTEIDQGNPFVGGLDPRRAAKYSDFEPFEGYISETMQDIT